MRTDVLRPCKCCRPEIAAQNTMTAPSIYEVLLKRRPHAQVHEDEMRRMASRMESTEMRQQQMMAFLARAVNNPAFLQQLLSARQNQRTLDSKGTCAGCA